MWLWRREGKSFSFAVVGAILLVLYGIVPTLQPANFGMVPIIVKEGIEGLRGETCCDDECH